MNQDTFPGTSIAAVYAHSEQKKYSSLTLFYPFTLVKIQNNFEKHKQRGGANTASRCSQASEGNTAPVSTFFRQKVSETRAESKPAQYGLGIIKGIIKGLSIS